ncbi:MAG: hypothetical protein J6M18_04625 [Actinomycetaceae bacterium]|nr:hypothetical protein [Actinomycetaceae bacterium]
MLKKFVSTRNIILSFVVALALVVFPVQGAFATSNSNTVYFGGGYKATANMWIQPISSRNGCGNYKSSVIANFKTTSVENTTRFYQIGFGSINIKGVSAGTTRDSNRQIRWKNTRGQRGAYISGNVCGGWGALYVGADVWGDVRKGTNARFPHARV